MITVHSDGLNKGSTFMFSMHMEVMVHQKELKILKQDVHRNLSSDDEELEDEKLSPQDLQ